MDQTEPQPEAATVVVDQQPIDESQSLPVDNICVICGNPSKYKCPACEKQSCSLQCSKDHKSRFNCTGQLDPTRKLAKKELLTPLAVNRDYNFLQQLGRDIHLEKDTASSLGKRQRDYMRNGVRIRAMPPSMSRAQMNKSGFNKQKKMYMWTVEMVRPDAQPEVIYIPETTLIQELDQDIMLKNADGELIKVKPEDTLGQALKGQTVLEFPTFVKVDPTTMQESSAESSSESETDSSEDESESESDSAPNEESAKEPPAQSEPAIEPDAGQEPVPVIIADPESNANLTAGSSVLP